MDKAAVKLRDPVSDDVSVQEAKQEDTARAQNAATPKSLASTESVSLCGPVEFKVRACLPF